MKLLSQEVCLIGIQLLGLTLEDPTTRSIDVRASSLIEITSHLEFLRGFYLIETGYIYDDNINIPVLDEGNFLFGNTIHSTSGPYRSVVPTVSNSGPPKLNAKGDKQIYMPFYYEFKKNSDIVFKNNYSLQRYYRGLNSLSQSLQNPTPLLFGGSGMTQAGGAGFSGKVINTKVFSRQ